MNTIDRHGMPELPQLGWRSVDTGGGVRIRYGVAGDGAATMLLIHGYPETAIAWRKLVGPLTAAGFRVVTPDVRGAGGSSRPLDGYDKLTLAADCAAVLDDADIEGPVIVVGHDIGLMIAYAFARRFPKRTSHLAALDAPLPGTDAFDKASLDDSRVWHFHFHQARDIPEALTAGRESYYLDRFWHDLAYDAGAIDAATKASYVADFSGPGGMRAGFELYRAFSRDREENRAALARDGKLTMPVLAIAGEASAFAAIIEPMMREVAETVTKAIIPQAGHWIAEENPGALANALIGFARTEVWP
ncbi:alpha/beta hydrolase [Sinorhizobium sp. BJ1]|uniref:alpha/beta fold hydrolase n=1 Tax=Sinorhizobium sp. BJ1 TaxID=2035455 RepID=UPI000BE85B52|nr:alpha/beta hydrolase [Sinorhizobium sp. BJ1]PDT82215.1 alpha/beta hydrolase [Sinorhizobium sp. BJ1]